MPLDNAETEDTTEDTESRESLRLRADGLRGGKAGVGGCCCKVDSLLGGNRGGGLGFAEFAVPFDRRISGGGSIPFEGPPGSFPMPLLVEDALGKVAEVERSMGGLGGEGLGLVLEGTLTGLLPTCPRFNAAILS